VTAVQDGPCQHCGRRYPPWWADHDWWNAVMEGPDGMLCPTCFLILADDGRAVVHIPRPSPAVTTQPDASDAPQPAPSRR
jgi:hypothetical protein